MGAPGFDDSPPSHLIRLRDPYFKSITFIYPYYENPQFLKYQLEVWGDYSPQARERVRVIVVDDGSPNHPAEKVLEQGLAPIRIRLFRIDADVRWNWLAARNIGMKWAFDGWCALTDMDHVISHDVAMALISMNHDPDVIYRFGRCEHTGEVIHPHPNSMFMTKQKFWQVGGYDEALSGHYGTDGDWRRRCAQASKVMLMPERLIRHEYCGDSSTIRYKRKQPEDAGKKAIIARRGKGWRPKTLSFPYHEVVLL